LAGQKVREHEVCRTAEKTEWQLTGDPLQYILSFSCHNIVRTEHRQITQYAEQHRQITQYAEQHRQITQYAEQQAASSRCDLKRQTKKKKSPDGSAKQHNSQLGWGARVCIKADTIIIEQILSKNETVETTEPLTFGCDDA